MSPKLMLFLATQKGYVALEHLLENGLVSNVGCVITFPEKNVTKDWEPLIKEKCSQYQISWYTWKEAKFKLQDILTENNINAAVAISWRHMLPTELNNFLTYPLIIFHDSLLPKYRGFAPTPTAIMAGEEEIGVTAFFAVEEVDAGDIISQAKIKISQEMYIKDIIAEQTKIYASMLEKIIYDMKAQSLKSASQNNSAATYSIWRNEADCLIDWTKSAKSIFNFVRALGEPYPNAFTYCEGKKIYILKVKIIADKNFILRDCGKIWSIKDNQPEIICGAGMLRILEARDAEGEIFLFKKLRCRLGINF